MVLFCINNRNVRSMTFVQRIVEWLKMCNSLHVAPSGPHRGRNIVNHRATPFVITNGFKTSVMLAPIPRNRVHVPKPKAFLIYVFILAMSLPGTDALLFDAYLPGSKRVIPGVLSTSAGVILVPLQAHNYPTTLLWMAGAFWAVTYAAFLSLAFQRVARRKRSDGPIYLFCAFLLAAHFVSGFTKPAETVTEATKGLFMFGPLVTTFCTVLVYIPFRYRALEPIPEPGHSVATGSGRSIPAQRRGLGHDSTHLGQEGTAADPSSGTLGVDYGQHHGEGGDVALASRLMHAVVGIAV